jgi:hypothetical protein
MIVQQARVQRVGETPADGQLSTAWPAIDMDQQILADRQLFTLT